MIDKLLKWYLLQLEKKRAKLRADVLSQRLKIDFLKQLHAMKNARFVLITKNLEEGENE